MPESDDGDDNDDGPIYQAIMHQRSAPAATKFKTEEDSETAVTGQDEQAQAQPYPLLLGSHPSNDRMLMTSLVHNIVQNLDICFAGELDVAKRKKKKANNIKIGTIGLSCRHCNEQNAMTTTMTMNGRGRFFICSEVKILSANMCGNIKRHLIKCENVPPTIRDKIVVSEVVHDVEKDGCGGGGLSTYFSSLFERLKQREEEFMATLYLLPERGGEEAVRVQKEVVAEEEKMKMVVEEEEQKAEADEVNADTNNDDTDEPHEIYMRMNHHSPPNHDQENNNNSPPIIMDDHEDDPDYRAFPFHSDAHIENTEIALLPPELRHLAEHPFHAALLGQYTCTRATVPCTQNHNRIGFFIQCRYCSPSTKFPYELPFLVLPVYKRTTLGRYFKKMYHDHSTDRCEGMRDSTKRYIDTTYKQLEDRLGNNGERDVCWDEKFSSADSLLDAIWERLTATAKSSFKDYIREETKKEMERKREVEEAAAAGAARARQEQEEQERRDEREMIANDTVDSDDDIKPSAIRSDADIIDSSLRNVMVLSSAADDIVSSKPETALSNPAVQQQQHQRKKCTEVRPPSSVKSSYDGPSVAKAPNPFKDANAPDLMPLEMDSLIAYAAQPIPTDSFQTMTSSVLSDVSVMPALISKSSNRSNAMENSTGRKESLLPNRKCGSSAGQPKVAKSRDTEKVPAKVDGYMIPQKRAALDEFSNPRKKKPAGKS